MNTGMRQVIQAAWEKHAQRVHYQFPGGCGGHIPLQTPEVMAELGFHQAVKEIFEMLVTAAGTGDNDEVRKAKT